MRKKAFIAGMAVCVAGCAIFLWLVWPGPGITRPNPLRIPRGGGEADVEALLGMPAGVHTTDGANWADVVQWAERPEGIRRKLWVADAGAACVDFNRDGQVMEASWVPCQESLWSMVRDGLGL